MLVSGRTCCLVQRSLSMQAWALPLTAVIDGLHQQPLAPGELPSSWSYWILLRLNFILKRRKKGLSKGNLYPSALKQRVSRKTGGRQFGFMANFNFSHLEWVKS